MDAKGAFAALRQAIEANEKDLPPKQAKALALAGLIIAEELLQDFKRMANAVELMSRRDHVGSKPQGPFKTLT